MRKSSALLIALTCLPMYGQKHKSKPVNPYVAEFAAHPDHAKLRDIFINTTHDALSVIDNEGVDRNGNITGRERAESYITSLEEMQQTTGELIVYQAIYNLEAAQQIEVFRRVGYKAKPMMADVHGCLIALSSIVDYSHVVPASIPKCDMIEYK